jgi:hypothetical protein
MTFLLIPGIFLLARGTESDRPKFLDNRLSSLRGLPKNKSFLSFFLVLAAIFPYLSVGKSTDLGQYTDWTFRQAFPLVLAIAFLTASFYELASTASKQILRRRNLSAFLVLLFSSLLLVYGFSFKINRQVFEANFVKFFSQNIEPPPPGLVQIVGEGIPGPDFRTYESNWVLYETYNEIHYWSRFGGESEPNFGVPLWLSQVKSEAEYLYLESDQKCNTVIKIYSDGYKHPTDYLLNMVGLGGRGKIVFDSVETKCL